MPKALVIVESPAKAKTIEKFLGKSHYTVKASVGHIRDLPKSRLGVDIENDFEPDYINIRGKGDVIKDLKKTAKKATKVYLATDPDREGEAISWHLEHILGIDLDAECRIEFNEITKDKIKAAIKTPRKVDKDLVDAQQARRLLDRLLGYQISPVLWQKVRKGLSAGRVQSVTTRIICDREKDIDDFKPEEYWSLDLDSKTKNNDLIKLFFYGEDGKKIDLKNEKQVNEIIENIKNKKFDVSKIDTKTRKRTAPKPFTTSALQQEGVNKLNFTTKKTMKIAQELYEGVNVKGEGAVGLISYIRTDSNRLSDEAKQLSKEFILDNYGEQYYKEIKKEKKEKKAKDGKKSKKVQDAHEAIRPTNALRTPNKIKDSLSKDQYKLYNLIWRRFMASQMSDSLFEVLNIECTVENYMFKAKGSKKVFDGYTKVYNFSDREDSLLPSLEVGEKLSIEKILPQQHFTQPPARYTEASLVKKLEELGIGRPSTYAPTISTILNRGYVEKEATSLKPTDLGKIVNELLKENFTMLTEIDYTAQLERRLDEVEDGDLHWKKVVEESYEPLKSAIEEAKDNIEKINVDEPIDEYCETCGAQMVIKHGRFGKFIACSNYPECKTTKPIVTKVGIKCPKCKDGDVIVRKTKKGRVFYGCSNYPNCDFVTWNKPTGNICDVCGDVMVEKVTKKETKEICANKECPTNIKKKTDKES